VTTGSPRREARAVHDDLLRAGETMTVSWEALRKRQTETGPGSEAAEADLEDIDA